MSSTIEYTFALKYDVQVSTVALLTDSTWTTGAPQPWWGGGHPDDPPSGKWAVTYDQGSQVTLMDGSGGKVGVLYNCNLETLRGNDSGEFYSYLNGKTGQWIYPPVGTSASSLAAKPAGS
jgi:hypothetical protein